MVHCILNLELVLFLLLDVLLQSLVLFFQFLDMALSLFQVMFQDRFG